MNPSPVEQIANPISLTRNCSRCAKPALNLVPVQFIADPMAMPKTPDGKPRWRNIVDFACDKCRKATMGKWRLATYHPDSERDIFTVYAAQLVPDIRVITLQEPWAWIVAQWFKDVENRKWHSNFTGRVFIHSGRAFDPSFDSIEHHVGQHRGLLLPSRDWLKANHMGRIVAVAEFGPMVSSHLSPWKMPQRWAWPIKWCYPMTPSEPVRGMLGLWRLPHDTMRFSVEP